MPVFDYRCEECGMTYDVYHKVREIQEDISCPQCGSPKHTRLMSAPSISMGSTGYAGSESASSCSDGGCCGGSCGLD